MRVLITGAYGFLGKHVAKEFKKQSGGDYHIIGMGHGKWNANEFKQWGIDEWIEATITLESLNNCNKKFDVIVHCGGNGSVALSYKNPYEDFQKTVQSTLAVLEYIRLQAPECILIYPSTPAAQGDFKDIPIKEDAISLPISPYGFNKKIAEDICLSYRKNYNLNIGIIRFFSIYGEGLQKQLLYDACKKISQESSNEITFEGTGLETRDWINIKDASSLVYTFAQNLKGWDVINGASGIRTEVRQIIELLLQEFNKPLNLKFNNVVREGNPFYFWADMSHTEKYNWKPKVSLKEGIKSYVAYYKKVNK